MKFGLIKPKEQSFQIVDCKDILVAQDQLGLKSGEIDFAQIHPRISIVVYEFGLFLPVKEQSYFAMRRYLYAGNAVLFATNDHGETVSFDVLPDELQPRWFKFAEEVEWAIDKNLLIRPRLMLNGREMWKWPDPKPNWMGR